MMIKCTNRLVLLQKKEESIRMEYHDGKAQMKTKTNRTISFTLKWACANRSTNHNLKDFLHNNILEARYC